MPLGKIKIIVAATIIVAVYLFAAIAVLRERNSANLYECPLCGQLVR